MPLIRSSRCFPADWIRCRSGTELWVAAVVGFLLQELAVENDAVQRRAELVAHAGQELALGARRRLGLPLRDPQLIDQRRGLLGVQPLGVVRQLQIARLARQFLLGLLPRANLLLERRGSLGRLLHLRDAAAAGDDEDDVLEDDPGRVLQPPPLAGDDHAIHRLRPEDAAKQVIQRDDDRGRDQHSPVAIEREEGERAEDVKVRLDPSSGQVDQERAHQHLGDGDDVARRRQARPEDAEQRREQADHAAHDERGPHVQVGDADRARTTRAATPTARRRSRAAIGRP